MKLAFIQAPAWGRDCPPYTMCFLATLVRHKGHEAYLFDLNNALYHTSPQALRKMWDDKDYYCYWENAETVEFLLESNRKIIDYYVERILNSGARIIGFTVHFSSAWASLALAREIKKRDENRIIVFGGPDCSRQMKGDYFIAQDCVDIVVQGEGEKPLLDIIEKVDDVKHLRQLKGCLLLRDNEIIDGGYVPGIADLDSLPAPDYSDFRDEIQLRLYREPHRLDIFDSRGCITGCHFCSEWQFWGKFRSKSGRKIFKEITAHMKDFSQVYSFYFIGSLINGDMEALETLCDLVISHKLKIQWAGQAVIRPEMTERLLTKLKQSGCTWLSYGIESGSRSVLDKMNKKFSLEVASGVLKATKNAGIGLQVNFMFGLPTETKDDFNLTLQFLKDNRQHMDTILASQSFCVIDKGTYLYNHPDEFGIKNRRHHLYWESNNGENDYAERNRRYEEFCRLALSLGIPETSGVLRNKPDKWHLLGDYYLYKQDYPSAIEHYQHAERFEMKTRSLLDKLSTCYEQAGLYDKAIETLHSSTQVKNSFGNNGLSDETIAEKVASLEKLSHTLKSVAQDGDIARLGNFSLIESATLDKILKFFTSIQYKKIDLEKILTDLGCNEKQKSMSRALYSHGLWLKLSNYLLTDVQKSRKEPFLFGYPYWLVIDPCNYCNLRCPFCPTGQRRNVRTKGALNPDDFKRIIDKLGPYLIHVDLVNWGEPLLNEHIFDMVAYAKQHHCDIKIDSNLNLLTRAHAERLVLSGLDKIVVSIDGLTEDTYSKYRQGGDFRTAMNNLILLVKKRRELKKAKPYITWQFLVFRHNEHEIKKAVIMGKKIGVDHVGITKAFIGDKAWMPLSPEYSNYYADKISENELTSEYFKTPQDMFCSWPWEAIAINTNSSVSACCSVEEEKDDFGNFFDQPFEELWNGLQYQTARNYIRDKKQRGSNKNNICIGCRHLGLINIDILSCHSFFD